MAMTSPPADPDAAAAVDPAAVAALSRASAKLADSTDRDPSPGLLPAVMHTVWAELRGGRRIPLPGSNGALQVTETAVSNALVAELDDLAELTIRRCTVTPAPPATTGTAAVRVALTAAVAYGSDTEAVAGYVRTVITATAERQFGFTVDQVDIDIVDVYERRGR